MKNIIRSISVFSKTESEFLLGQIILPEIALDDIKKIINPIDGDSEYYYVYSLNEETLKRFLNLLPDYHATILNIDFDIYEYHLEAGSIGN